MLDIARTVQERQADGTLSESKPLWDYQDVRAWVLLGDPGAGKTTTFQALAQAHGHKPVTARDFIELAPPPNGYPTPIFIDGLDEYTAGAGSGFTAIGCIRSRLQELGTPPFRLSCREADWRGSTDSEALQQLVGEPSFAELHLEPLNDTQVLQLTAHWFGSNEADAHSFMLEARRKDLGGLLTNPQTLRLLIDAVGSKTSDWPDSKKQIYEKACAKLVREQNKSHLAAQRDSACTDLQLLDAAGYLCAVMLLSGSTAIALQRQVEEQPHVVVLNALVMKDESPTLQSCRDALHTNLFVGDGKGNHAPIHRTVAEYLGAQYLAQRIQAGLPANRVLALLQGGDAGVVPEMRGLHAWLAVVAHGTLRQTLIDHDPLGLVLHGDVQMFCVPEKTRILLALQQEAKRYAHFRYQNWTSRPFGALATQDMQDTFKAWLQTPDRSQTHQAVLDCVVDAMRYGSPMSDLSPELEQLTADNTCWPSVRQNALTILCRYADASNDWHVAQRILQAVHDGTLEDKGNELLGILLTQMYPRCIRAQDLWRYYKLSSLDSTNDYWLFWRQLAIDTTLPNDIPVLMEALLATDIRLRSVADEDDLSEIIGDLLYRAVVHFAERTPIERVYAWFTLGLGAHSDNRLPRDKHAAIAQWLSEHSHVYKQLVEYSLTQLERSAEPEHLWLYRIHVLLCEAEPPPDAVQWYEALAQSRHDAFRQQLLREVFRLRAQEEGANAALEWMEQWAKQHPADQEWITKGVLTCTYPPDEVYWSWISSDIERKKQKSEEKAKELAFLRKELPKLTSDQADLGLLIHVGEAYLNFFLGNRDTTPRERLEKKLNDDPHWVELALAGLRHCLKERDDLPSVSDILDKHLHHQRYNIAIPCLAAMQLFWDETPNEVLRIVEPRLAQLIAFRLTNNFGNTPDWFLSLVTEKPDLVASVMQPLMVRQIAAQAPHVECLYALAHDPAYGVIAQKISPALIDALPTKVSKAMRNTLQELITCLQRTCTQAQQHDWIAAKLANPKLDVAQRVYWLTAGVQVAPDVYLQALKTYLGQSQTRVTHANDLLRAVRQDRNLQRPLMLEVKAFFIELLGARFTPAHEPALRSGYIVTPAIESMHFVQQLIASMATDPSDTAQAMLSKLLENPALSPWQDSLKHALYEQQFARRKALFRAASVSEICSTLANLQPANAADLHALVVDHLQQLAHDIRHSNTNDYTQYWRDDTPKIENDCRDALLSDLKKHLSPLGVNAEPEGVYADQKRADIKVLYQTMQLPIEIKCDSHADLWTAIQTQLIAKYSREHSSDGYGIYIVFWFDKARQRSPGDGGTKPKTPQELQQRLVATVPAELRKKIAVLVIDCAKPSFQESRLGYF